ncbi:MAG: anaerobic ribonucleoside-triphosphate reductase activating protein [Desulfobulbales bacterium]
MIIGGMQRCSLSDYPGRVAAVLFTQGCNFRCPFCHNGSLLPKKGAAFLDESMVLDFLRSRCGRLGGVVITGGEPTEHADLPQFISRVKEFGFDVKLDTNGSHPEMVEQLLQEGLVDYIAMDIKAPLAKYDTLCGVNVDIRAIRSSIALIAAGMVPHHFRTTHVKSLLTESDLAELRSLVPSESRHLTQPFIPETAWKQDLWSSTHAAS